MVIFLSENILLYYHYVLNVRKGYFINILKTQTNKTIQSKAGKNKKLTLMVSLMELNVHSGMI